MSDEICIIEKTEMILLSQLINVLLCPGLEAISEKCYEILSTKRHV